MSTIESRDLVLASCDLMTLVLSLLDIWDTGSPRACKIWNEVWIETQDRRRGLRSGSLLPEIITCCETVSYHPESQRLYLLDLVSEPSIRILDDEMNLHQSMIIDRIAEVFELMVTTTSLYVIGSNFDSDWEEIRCYSLYDNSLVSRYQDTDEYHIFNKAVIGPNQLIYVVCRSRKYINKIVALDSLTLEKKFEFGKERLENSLLIGMTIIKDTVYVSDSKRGICVFSLGGTFLREILGEWDTPKDILYHNERLYLIEDTDFVDCQKGHRIFVLSLEGDPIQVYQPEEWRTDSICLDRLVGYGSKLLVKLENENEDDSFICLDGI